MRHVADDPMMTTVDNTRPGSAGPLPVLTALPAAGPTRAVALVLHGGRAHSAARTHAGQLAYRRMAPFARSVHRACRDQGAAVWLLRNRVRGWNEPALDPVTDATWALRRIAEEHPGVPVLLIGHSMGARAALRVAGTDGVRAVCALAPWVEPGEPVAQLAGRDVLIAHGTKDTWTDRGESFRYAVRASAVTRVTRFEVTGSGHPMLTRAGDWHRLVALFARHELGDPQPLLADVLDPAAGPAPDGLHRPLPRLTARSTGGAR
jgi:dienelactone hydrolase